MKHALWLMAAVVVCGCKNDLDRVAAVDVPLDAPDRVTTNAEYTYSDSGRVRNRLHAGVIREYMAQGHEHTDLDEGVRVVFFDPDGTQGSVLTSDRGSMLKKQNRMRVEGNVVFTNKRGERLETEELLWSQDSARVWTNKPVRIIRSDDIIYGQGLDANEDFTRYTLRHISGSLYIDTGDTLAP